MADKPYRVALMARVSTPKQGEKPMSLPQQYQECHEYAAKRGWVIVKELEDRYSGMKWSRPGLRQAIDLAKQGKIDGVLAKNHDRLCRDDDVRGWLKTELKQQGARIHYTSEPDEPDSPESRFTDGMMGVAARYLRDKAVVALSDGRVARVHDGKILHNGTAPYGYDFNDDETGYVAHLVEAPWVTRMFERYADGWSPNRIAAWLNTEPGAPKPRRAEQWGRPSVNGILQREDYTGTGPRLGWELPTDEHGRPLSTRPKRTGEGVVMMSFPDLISPELWRQSLAMRKEAAHHTSYGKTDPNAALFKGTGRVICAGCDKPMAYESQDSAKDRKIKGLYRCRRSGCPNSASVRRFEVDDMALCTIHDIVMDDVWLEARYEASMEAGGEIDQEIDMATAAIKELTRKKRQFQKRVVDAAGDDLLYEPLAEQLRTIQAQLLAAQEHEVRLLQQRAQTEQDATKLRDFGLWLAEHREGFYQLDVPGLRRLASLIDLTVRVTRTPKGTFVKAVGRIILEDPLGWFTEGTPEFGRTANVKELERVVFDSGSTNRSSRRAHRSGTAGDGPSDRPAPGTPRSRRGFGCDIADLIEMRPFHRPILSLQTAGVIILPSCHDGSMRAGYDRRLLFLPDNLSTLDAALNVANRDRFSTVQEQPD